MLRDVVALKAKSLPILNKLNLKIKWVLKNIKKKGRDM